MEGGRHAFSFGSGLAAEDAIIRGLMRPGQRLVMGNDAYGGTYRLFARVHGDWESPTPPSTCRIMSASPRSFSTATRPCCGWRRPPTLMGVTDIRALADIAHAHDALLVVDNTFATPYLQQPLSLGADVVVHSTTKYIGGHSDVVGGAVVLGEGTPPMTWPRRSRSSSSLWVRSPGPWTPT
ncbi:PLP-dependent transferase [Nesterenkonia pannonica]|uniref:PLP-dependent transferase n=1 Tax=Nesterenkonia pannonica TaxID=1548602 RepID=UPI0021642A2E|nr:PLP-dependent transferase [Nesterenkonia pannonica]